MKRRNQLFYTINDRTDDSKYLKRKGFIPYQVVTRTLDGNPFDTVVKYQNNGFIYEVLDPSQCYSGYMITLMKLPKLSYEELLKVALDSCHVEERAGAVGIILKEHPEEFEKFLEQVKNVERFDEKFKKKIRRLLSFVCDFIGPFTSFAQRFPKIMSTCEEIKRMCK